MLASHADREQVVDLLKVAFVQERLAKDEFDLRIGQALASRTVAELAALTADIPVGPTTATPAARPPRLPARNQKAVKTLACVTAGAVSLFALPYAVTVLTDGQPPHAQTVMFLVVVFTAFAVPLAAVLLQAWLAKHHSRPSVP
jgi:NhaP-type Na+/H+ or K+/H+ antiporter